MNYLESMQEMCDEYRKNGGNFAKFAISKEKDIGSWRYATEASVSVDLNLMLCLAESKYGSQQFDFSAARNSDNDNCYNCLFQNFYLKNTSK
jgi:hypothetical protein